jgi:O-antigen/teichoic acid export membrane protein
VSAGPPPAGVVVEGAVPDQVPAGEGLIASRGPLVSASMAMVAVFNYGGALALAYLLDARSYSQYAAAATLLGSIGVFAAALIPLPLTHVIRTHPRGSEERRRGMAFAWSVAAAAGLVAASVTAALTAAFAEPTVVAAVAVSAMVLFLASPVWGWLHGELLFVRNTVVLEAEILVRILVGIGVVVLGWTAGGALLGFVAGSLVVLACAPRALWRDLVWRPGVLGERGRWAETGDIALSQLIVYTLIGADVVMVALLADHDAGSAGYQALSTLAKAPIYMAAGSVAVAFPLLRSGNVHTESILAATLRSFALLSIPVAAIVATAPRELVLLLFPDRYASSLSLLPVLAAAGLGYAALTVLASVLMGLRAYRRCQAGLLTAVVIFPAGLLLGWRADGVPGLALGAAGAALVAAGALWAAAAPLLPDQTFRRALRALLPAAALVALLTLASHVPVLWVIAVLLLAGAALRLLRRPGTVPTNQLEIR